MRKILNFRWPLKLTQSGSCWNSANRNERQCARFPCHLWSNTKAQARTSSQVRERPGSCPTERRSPTQDSPCGHFYFFSLENLFMCLCLFESCHICIGDLGDRPEEGIRSPGHGQEECGPGNHTQVLARAASSPKRSATPPGPFAMLP